MELDALSLSGTGLEQQEIEAVLRCTNRREMIRRLRLCRCRVLEDIHKKQQDLDRLDYIITRIRNDS